MQRWLISGLAILMAASSCRHSNSSSVAGITASATRQLLHHHTPTDRSPLIYRWFNAPTKPTVDTAWSQLQSTAQYFHNLPPLERSSAGFYTGNQSGPGAYFASDYAQSFSFGRYLMTMSLPPDTDILDTTNSYPDDTTKALQSNAKLIAYAWPGSNPSAPKPTAFVLRGLSGFDKSMLHVYDRGTGEYGKRDYTSVPYARPATDVFDALEVITSTDYFAFYDMWATDQSSFSVVKHGLKSYESVLLAASGKDAGGVSDQDRFDLRYGFLSGDADQGARMASESARNAAYKIGLSQSASGDLTYEQLAEQIIATLNAKDPSIATNLRSQLDLGRFFQEQTGQLNVLSTWQDGAGHDAVFIDHLPADSPDKKRSGDGAAPEPNKAKVGTERGR